MKNTLKEKVQSGKNVIGTFIQIAHPDITERLSRLGFDWLLIDGEHTPLGFESMQVLMQAMNGSNCTPIVRPQWNDMVIIKRVLDIGAQGVLVPWVNTKEEAEYAARAVKYPPVGLRGFGPRRASLFDPDYFKTANKETLVIIQVETGESIKNLDDILRVDGIDGCYIGPFDLSINLGYQGPKWDDPNYTGAFDKVLQIAKNRGKAAGMFCLEDTVEWAIEKGFKVNTVGNDDSFLIRGAQIALEKAKAKK